MTLYGKEHVERYEATGGAEGYRWRNGSTVLLLHTTGRHSGTDYVHPLIFRDFGDACLVVASKGGSDAPPDWLRNLEAEPTVRVQIRDETFIARARIATPEEKPAMWERMVQAWPPYAEYQQKTEREIPVVVLDRA